MRSDLSLYSFQDYRNQRMYKLPPHDFAALISFRYAGGLAFVEGMCTDKAVMLCGFYPQDPSAMGSIFFHEVAHLVGVPHRPANNSINVSNCPCTGHEPDSTMGCLKIPGFDHDCTTQQFVNVIYKNKCIRTKPMKTRSESICGNGVLEEDEQCDCGLQRQCVALNCVPETCLYRLHPAWIWLIVFSLLSTSILLLYFILKNREYISMLNCFKQQKYKQSGFNNPGTIRNFNTSPFHQKKELPLISMEQQNSIVVILDAPPRSAATIQRPKLPPPPPPPKATISVEPGANLYEVPCTRQSIQDDLSWKFEDFESGAYIIRIKIFMLKPVQKHLYINNILYLDEEIMVSNQLTYSSYRGRPGVPTCPSYPSFSPINRVTVRNQ
uniref:Peptidase M12B domain-containing protein n=1 Tax=Heterorhabditis bacteriophora TaxID=37862 RepID=A0A1I7XUZ5_HETBA